ncbi:hypothetical protein BZA70DRAFT_279730 [Myxozyma melibiosi]|uniref:Phospholipase C n=1 Tax=Myxozyma melibiosi TaxID=54550 RepID=A0ABR1F4A8_9ASCO
MVHLSKLVASQAILLGATLASCASIASSVTSDDLAQIKHIVLFMQENRAFDHYYGTMAGVRGFKDPNVKITNGKSVWYQPTSSDKADYLLPWYLSGDGTYSESAQCMVAGSNDWSPNHNAWNFGDINGWVTNNTAWSWGHFKRDDIPTHFGIVEGWTVGDMYQESVIGPTNPNRVTWVSGTINIDGSQGDVETYGGRYIENHETDGCETGSSGIEYACYPLAWKTVPEYFEDAGISWFLFQDEDNFDDNPLAFFSNFQDADSNSTLAEKGLAYAGLESFYEMAANGTLPEVSYIVGPAELSEHPPYQPVDGAWLQQRILDAITSSPKYNETVLIYSYDETGGWGDHVPPVLSTNGTTGEWFTDPEDPDNYVPSGPGFRVPFYVVSPWTRGGKVFTEPADHNSQILFLEQWAKAIGKDFTSAEMTTWRREHMSNLINMFDFENPDYSIPTIANTSYPSIASDGSYNGYSLCEEKYSTLYDRRTPVPYGNQTEDDSLYTEDGYKEVRGQLTEGRYLVFTQTSDDVEYALKSHYSSSYLKNAEASDDYSASVERFVLIQVGDEFSDEFYIKSIHNTYLHYSGEFYSSKAEASTFIIDFTASEGYTIYSEKLGKYLAVRPSKASPAFSSKKSYFTVYSVTY